MDSKMMASILYGPKDIRYEEVNIPKLEKNEVLIKVAYAGICGSDLSRSNNENGARLYPIILGHEFSGVVAEVGTSVKNIKIGDRVVVAPLIPDPESIYTKEGIQGLSDNYTIIGTGCNGAFAEYVKVPEEHTIILPNEIDLETAAGIEPAAIAYHAFRQSHMQVGDTVAILGCGSIGQFAIQCAKIFGASKIIAVDIFEDKLSLAKELGATHTINSKKENLEERIKELTTYGVNVAIETAGSAFTQTQSLLITRKRGNIVFVGITHTPLNLSESEAERILRSELTIRGSWNSYTSPYPGRAWQGTIDAMAKGEIVFKPMISHKINLKELGKYLVGMYNKSIPFNKVIVDFSLLDKE